MATIKDTSFESNFAAEGFSASSALPPVITNARAHHLTQSFRSNVVNGPADPEGNAQWDFPAPPTSASFRMYVNFDTWEPNFQETFTFITEPTGSNYLFWRADDTGGSLSIFPSFSPGVHDLNFQNISYDTWYRLEWKLDVSATGWKATWGIATGDGALTTMDTDATGGNPFAADTLDYFNIGMDTWAANTVYYDAVKFTDSGADYPLGPVTGAPAVAGEGNLLLMGVG